MKQASKLIRDPEVVYHSAHRIATVAKFPRREFDDLRAECVILLEDLCKTTDDVLSLTEKLLNRAPGSRWSFPSVQAVARQICNPEAPPPVDRATAEQFRLIAACHRPPELISETITRIEALALAEITGNRRKYARLLKDTAADYKAAGARENAQREREGKGPCPAYAEPHLSANIDATAAGRIFNEVLIREAKKGGQ